MREMILAADEEGRRSALERLLPIQQSDFEGIFEAMAGLPVTIRLLDWPLHEFLPSLEEEQEPRDARADPRPAGVKPMLGWRACRLGLFFPEIYEMQSTSCFATCPAGSSGIPKRVRWLGSQSRPAKAS